MRWIIWLLVAIGCAGARGQMNTPVAVTPPMGWNSWDSYGLTINEGQFRANVGAMEKSLLPFGYRYAVIDEGWFLKNPGDRGTPDKLQYEIDAFGRYIPVLARFPSSGEQGTAGFRVLGDYVHAHGMLFGIHIVRGIPRISVAANLPVEGSTFHAADAADTSDACPWDPTNWGLRDNAAGQAWYDALLRQYAGWGVDLLKVDCIADHPYRVTEIRMIRRAIEKAGRPMVLSLSPGPTSLDHAAEVGELAQMWRISDDIWDYWRTGKQYPHGVADQFAAAAAWASYARPGNWPDADMLPLGSLGPNPPEAKPRMTRLTHDEQRTQMTLWSMLRSPLIVGANLTELDEWTRALLTNRAVLEIDQHSHGGRELEHGKDLVVWRAEAQSGSSYLALFNLGETPLSVTRTLKDFGLEARSYRERNLWQPAPETSVRAITGTIAPHGCLLLELTAGPASR